MGSAESKSRIIEKKDQYLENPSTPHSENKKDIIELDPRSPSDNIIRTPLEIKTELPYSSSYTNDLLPLMTTLDPRSPTDQFQRTPVFVLDVKQTKYPILHNKHLDNVRRSIEYTPTLLKKSYQVESIATPPKLLASSPIIKKTSNKRKSFVGVLETNIDYTETNLDDFIKNKSLNSSVIRNDTERSFNCLNPDPRSPSIDFLRTPIQIDKKDFHIDFNNSAEGVSSEVDEIKYNHNTSLLKIVESDEKAELSKIEESQHIISDDQTENLINDIKTLSTIDDTVPLELKEDEIKFDLSADVEEFDKKLTKMINDNQTFSLKTKVDVENTRKRTPMKDRNLIEPKKYKLRVSDKPRKSANDFSKIPIFREKNRNIKADCENTPPSKIERKKKKLNKSLWDSEKTIVI